MCLRPNQSGEKFKTGLNPFQYFHFPHRSIRCGSRRNRKRKPRKLCKKTSQILKTFLCFYFLRTRRHIYVCMYICTMHTPPIHIHISLPIFLYFINFACGICYKVTDELKWEKGKRADTANPRAKLSIEFFCSRCFLSGKESLEARFSGRGFLFFLSRGPRMRGLWGRFRLSFGIRSEKKST